MTIEPCPFCGSEAVCNKVKGGPKVFCRSCLATRGANPFGTEAEAIEAWNRRTPAAHPTREPDAMTHATHWHRHIHEWDGELTVRAYDPELMNESGPPWPIWIGTPAGTPETLGWLVERYIEAEHESETDGWVFAEFIPNLSRWFDSALSSQPRVRTEEARERTRVTPLLQPSGEQVPVAYRVEIDTPTGLYVEHWSAEREERAREQVAGATGLGDTARLIPLFTHTAGEPDTLMEALEKIDRCTFSAQNPKRSASVLRSFIETIQEIARTALQGEDTP